MFVTYSGGKLKATAYLLSTIMVLAVLVVASNNAEGMVTSDAAYLTYNWPSSSTLMNQTVSSKNSDTYCRVGLAVNAWDTILNANSGTSHTVTLGISAGASCRNAYNYKMVKAVNNVNSFDNIWGVITSHPNDAVKVTLPNDGGIWVSLTRAGYSDMYSMYGAYFDMMYISSDGFIVLAGSEYYSSMDINSWNSAAPSLGSSQKPNMVLAPLWRDLNPLNGGEIWYLLLDGVVRVAWKDIPNDANSKPQSFGVVLHPVTFDTPTHPDEVKFLSSIWFSYGSITKDVTSAYGLEDQTGEHYASFSPLSKNSYVIENILGQLDYYTAIKTITIEATKYKWSAPNWIPDDKSWITISGTGSVTPGGINVQLSNPSDGGYSSSEALLWAGGFLLGALSMAIPPYALVPTVLGVAGMVLDTYSLVNELSTVPAPSNPDGTWGADPNEATAAIPMFAVDEKAKTCSAFDVTLEPLLHWNLNMDTSVSHRLAITVKIDYGDCRENTNTVSGSLSTSVHITVGPDPNKPSGVDWYGRTVPDGRYSNFETVPASSSPTGSIGYTISSGNLGSGYDVFGWSSLTNNMVDDYKVRSDGTIRVEGYFKYSNPETLPSNDWGSSLYVLYSDDDGDGYPDGSSKIIKKVPVLTSSDPIGEWRFKSVLVTGLTPGKAVKIGLGRLDTSDSNYVSASWAGVVVHGMKKDGHNEYVLYLSNSAGGTLTPSATSTYGTPYSDYPSSVYPVTATPSSSAYRVGYWILDGGGPEFGPASGSATRPVTMTQDHTLKATFISSSKKILLFKYGNTGGSVSFSPTSTDIPEPGMYLYSTGTSVTATAIPDLAHVLDKWNLDGTLSLSNPISVSMTSDRTLVVYFKSGSPQTYTLTVSDNTPTNAVTPSEGTHSCVAGSSVTVYAEPMFEYGNYRYAFVCWKIDGVTQKRGDYDITILMNGDHTASAVYKSSLYL